MTARFNWGDTVQATTGRYEGFNGQVFWDGVRDGVYRVGVVYKGVLADGLRDAKEFYPAHKVTLVKKVNT